jgi:lipopolysaccharide transport protein LptA
VKRGPFRILFGAVLLPAALSAFGAPEPAPGVEIASGTNKTVITAKRLTFDYQRQVAVFEEDVVVTDPNITMESDSLNVAFERGGGVESVVAVGNVRMNYGGRNGSCRKAIYLAKEGQLILLGDAELKRGRDSVKGNRIVFWIAEDRMTCEPGILVVYSDAAQAAVMPGLGSGPDRAGGTAERR